MKNDQIWKDMSRGNLQDDTDYMNDINILREAY